MTECVIPESERTAYHEAAHVALSIALGLGCKGVTIVPNFDAGEAGSALHGGGYSNDEDTESLRLFAESEFWLWHATALYAGAEAVRQLGIGNWRAGAEFDYSVATDAINKITTDPASIDLLFAAAQRHTVVLVEHYWPEIKSLASILVDKRTLSGEEAGRVFCDSTLARRARLRTW